MLSGKSISRQGNDDQRAVRTVQKGEKCESAQVKTDFSEKGEGERGWGTEIALNIAQPDLAFRVIHI
jgi:hypothetical protein